MEIMEVSFIFLQEEWEKDYKLEPDLGGEHLPRNRELGKQRPEADAKQKVPYTLTCFAFKWKAEISKINLVVKPEGKAWIDQTSSSKGLHLWRVNGEGDGNSDRLTIIES